MPNSYNNFTHKTETETVLVFLFNASVQSELLTNPLPSTVLDNSEAFRNWIVTQRSNPFSRLKKLSLFRYTNNCRNSEHSRIKQ